ADCTIIHPMSPPTSSNSVAIITSSARYSGSPHRICQSISSVSVMEPLLAPARPAVSGALHQSVNAGDEDLGDQRLVHEVVRPQLERAHHRRALGLRAHD